MKQADTLHSLI